MKLILKKGAERRILRGHDWLFSNEVQTKEKSDLEPPFVEILDYKKRFLAFAYYNEHSLISGRIISRNQSFSININDWLNQKIQTALTLREQLYPHHKYYRMIYSESDQLPGLIVDRFADYLSVQITTKAMLMFKDTIISTLKSQLNPKGIYINSDANFLALEGIKDCKDEWVGTQTEKILVKEGDLSFYSNFESGQKTGWFFDQRDNRLNLKNYVQNQDVLDLFCYAGAWGIHAAHYGAKNICFVDSSTHAIKMVNENTKLNQTNNIEVMESDAFDACRILAEHNRKFSLIIVDPPALIKRKKDYENGLQAYFQINKLATKLLSPNGILITCSCSHHLPEEKLNEIIQHCAKSQNRHAKILEYRGQSRDHPIHPAMPETSYLKTIICHLN